ncbi:hypothetical protein [Yinghuangia soli]|uniref:Phage tail tape measure protein n=1 Tax=Yinghuangia soli TaxID=2908204 RepID=A0AA41Q9K9_9ACTN|nr:hypothetical protein [Yinghuangia soli]MCF2532722.1 hypothetical protein [Yinghuangia soli]
MSLTRSLNALPAAFDRVQRSSLAATNRLKNVGDAADRTERQISRIKKTADLADNGLGKIKNGGQAATASFKNLGNPALQADKRLDGVKKSAQAADQAMGKIQKSAGQAGTGLSGIKNHADQADKAFGTGKKGAEGFSGAVNTLKTSADGGRDSLRSVKTQADDVEKSVGLAGKTAGGAGKAAFSGLGEGLLGAEKGQKALNTAMKGSLLGAVIALVLPLIEHFGGLDRIIQVVSDNFVKGVTWMRDGIKPVIEGIVNFFTLPARMATKAINFIIDQVNKLHFKMPGWLGGAEFGFNIARVPEVIPALAAGGIVRATPGGRLARIAEGGEAEAVIPLSKLEKYLALGRNGGPQSGFHIENYYEAGGAGPRQVAEQLMFLAKARG